MNALPNQTEPPKLPITDDRPYLVDKAVKLLRMRRQLRDIQVHLKPSDQLLSKLIHQPLVSKLSGYLSGTVARPSGLLGGGIVALIGNLTYLYMTHHAGFTYNYSFCFGFFVTGFALGVLGEYAAYWLGRLSAK